MIVHVKKAGDLIPVDVTEEQLAGLQAAHGEDAVILPADYAPAEPEPEPAEPEA